MRLGSRDGAVTGDWSKTGGAGEPQPDNREFKVSASQVKLKNSTKQLEKIPYFKDPSTGCNRQDYISIDSIFLLERRNAC